MMQVWSHRPKLSHLAFFFAAYLLGCGFATVLGIVPGTNISIWPPAGLFIATLILTSRYTWPWWILAGCPAELLGQLLWWHSPLPAGVIMYLGNALEAAVGAWLVNRFVRRPFRLGTLPEFLVFVVLAAGVAPVVSATVGSATLALFDIKSQSFWTAWPLWWVGDATGILLVAPPAMAMLQNLSGKARLSAARWIEAGVLGLIFLGAAGFSLSGHYLPFVYIIMPPLIWVAARFEFKGVAIALTLLALFVAVFAIFGASQLASDPEFQKQKQIELQLFLAISAFSALIVAAISRQYQLTLLTLRNRERELSTLVDMVPSHLWQLQPDGEPIFFNKQMVDFLGLDIADLDRPDLSRLDVLIEAIHPDDRATFGVNLKRCLVTGENFAARYRLRRLDGEYRWMSSRAEPMRDDGGRIVRWYGLCHDIDDQMRLYADVEERESKIRRLVDSDIIGIVIWDLDGRIIDANDAFLRMIQYDRDDLNAGLRWFDMTPPEWQNVHARDEAEELKATGKMQAREKEYFRKDGSRVPVLIGAACFEGQSNQGVAYILDLTDRKRAEAALRDRERELAQLVDMLPVYIRRLTPEGEPIFFNKRLTDFIGVGLAEIGEAGTRRLVPAIENFVHPDDVAKVTAALHRAVATGKDYAMRYRMRGSDGVYRWIETRAEPLRDQHGAITQWYSVSLDIDDEVRAQAALRERERELSQLVDIVPVHIRRLTPEGDPVFFNKRLVDFQGLSIGDLNELGMDRPAAAMQSLVHPEDLAYVKKTVDESLAAGKPYAMKYRIRRADGAYRWVDGRAEPVRDESGEIVQWYSVSFDIDDQVQAQDALRERERVLGRLVETLPALIYCAAPNGEPIYRSQQLIEFLGFNVRDKLGPNGSRLSGTLNAVIHPDELAAVKEQYAHSLLTGEPYAMRHRLRRADGKYRWVETRAIPMRNGDGVIVQWNAICLDIEDQVRAQESLRLAQEKMVLASQAASLAELSASIAHEVNQPLAAVVANSHACQRWLRSEPPNLSRAQMTVDRIIRDANSAADVVSRIRALFNRSTQSRKATAIGHIVSEVCELMAEEKARRQVVTNVEVAADIPLIALDRVQIQQVLTNLMRNGMEAMDGIPQKRALSIRVRKDGDAVRVEVRDRGQGIVHAEKIFDAFFSTKESGMGMGLAVSRSIVESHGGKLWAEGGSDGGATFIFTLPI